jgi:quercetin dioxygenase-like cupin family protein
MDPLRSWGAATMSKPEPFVVTPNDHFPLRVAGEHISVLADADRTGSIELFLQEGPEGAGPPPHVHAWDESYYVLEGAIEVLSGDHMQTVKQGEFMFVPGGTTHMFRIKTARARFLSFNSGGGAAAFFRDIDRTVGDTVDIPKMIQVASRHAVHAVARPPTP